MSGNGNAATLLPTQDPSQMTLIEVVVKDTAGDPIPDAIVEILVAGYRLPGELDDFMIDNGKTNSSGVFKPKRARFAAQYIFKVGKADYTTDTPPGKTFQGDVWRSQPTNCRSIKDLPEDPKNPGQALPETINAILKYRPGNPFLQFGNRVDHGLVVLLNELLTNMPQDSHAHQVAHFAYNELKIGNLIAAVRASYMKSDLKSELPQNEYDHLCKNLMLVDDLLPGIGAFAKTVVTPGWVKGYVAISNDYSSHAKRAIGFTDPNRNWLIVILAHELNHFRNRVIALNNIPRGYTYPLFVDTALAQKKKDNGHNSELTKTTFILEVAARHEAWYVYKELQGDPKPYTLNPGQLWNAVVDYASQFSTYYDSGYMKTLSTTAPDKFLEQVGIWFELVGQHLIFHYSSMVNKEIQTYCVQEYQLAWANNFKKITPVIADGLK